MFLSNSRWSFMAYKSYIKRTVLLETHALRKSLFKYLIAIYFNNNIKTDLPLKVLSQKPWEY